MLNKITSIIFYVPKLFAFNDNYFGWIVNWSFYKYTIKAIKCYLFRLIKQVIQFIVHFADYIRKILHTLNKIQLVNV